MYATYFTVRAWDFWPGQKGQNRPKGQRVAEQLSHELELM